MRRTESGQEELRIVHSRERLLSPGPLVGPSHIHTTLPQTLPACPWLSTPCAEQAKAAEIGAAEQEKLVLEKAKKQERKGT